MNFISYKKWVILIIEPKFLVAAEKKIDYDEGV